jgi:hypothetical protein
MTKEYFQYMGKHHQIIDGAQYPAHITEGNGQLVNHPLDSPSPEEAEKWKHIERAAMNHGQTKSTKADTSWHALAAVKREEASKKHAS